MAAPIMDPVESMEACRERLLGYVRDRYSRDELSVADMEQRIERILHDDVFVERERMTWVTR